MVYKCFADGCTSGHKASEGEDKHTFFPVPKDLCHIWARIVPNAARTLNLKDRVCEKHFEDKYLIKEPYVHTASEIINVSENSKVKLKLTPDAIPTVYENLPYGQKTEEYSGVSNYWYSEVKFHNLFNLGQEQYFSILIFFYSYIGGV